MAKVDEDLVSTYFYLQIKIDRAKERIEQYEREFMCKNFYTGVQTRYEVMQTVAFKLEKEVVNHVAAIETAEQHIQTLQLKLKYFNRFWSGLNNSDKEYYTNRYKYSYEVMNDRLDNLIMDEVKEIEEAAVHCFRNSIPPAYYRKTELEKLEKPERLEDTPEDHFKAMMDQLGVI